MKTHCKHGHELAIVGRTKDSRCKACAKRLNDNFRRQHPENVAGYRARLRAKKQAAREKEIGRVKPPTCEVCGSDNRIVFEHDHATGKARGWLCSNCNAAIGLAGDNVERLLRLAIYLEKHTNVDRHNLPTDR